MWTSFSFSPSIILATGMPVHLATTSATSSASTSSLSILLAGLQLVQPLVLLAPISSSDSGRATVVQFRGPVQIALPLGRLCSSALAFSMLSLMVLDGPDDFLFILPVQL